MAITKLPLLKTQTPTCAHGGGRRHHHLRRRPQEIVNRFRLGRRRRVERSTLHILSLRRQPNRQLQIHIAAAVFPLLRRRLRLLRRGAVAIRVVRRRRVFLRRRRHRRSRRRSRISEIQLSYRGGGGGIERAVRLWIDAAANELPLDVSVPVIFDFIICSSRQSPCYQRPSAAEIQQFKT